MAYQFSYPLQQNPQFNIPVYPSTTVGGFTLGSLQSTLVDPTTDFYATNLYSWYVGAQTTPQPININIAGVGNVQLVSLSTKIFGPQGSSSQYNDSNPHLNEWVENPVTTYPTTYESLNCLLVGPSYSNAVQYVNNANQTVDSARQTSVWNFNIQPFEPNDVSGYTSYPISTAFGACNSIGNEFLCQKSSVLTGLTLPKYWFKVDLLNGPLGQTLPVPYYDGSGNYLTANVRTVFTTPYSPTYYNSNTYNTSSTNPLTGYFVVFYQVSPDLPSNTYPVIYDAANLQNQTNFDTDNPTSSALTFLNQALQTTYISVDNLFLGENWLEGTLLSETDGGSFATGVDLGTGFGDGWYVMGLVPYNLNTPGTTNQWVNSIQDYTRTTAQSTNDPYLFCSGNLTIASMVNPAGTGNVFWRSVVF